MHTAKLAATLLVLLALVFSAASAQAETVNCTHVTALPAVITVQGIYCFTGNLSTSMTSGNAIDIQTTNVVLDLNGFKLGGLAAGLGTTTVGIHALSRQNITIKNGTIRGFLEGIFLDTVALASQGHIVEDIRADQNTSIGIDVRGLGNIVRNNQLVATGGTTNFGPNADATGIAVVVGQSTRVLNNDVMNVTKQGTGTARGIYFALYTGICNATRIHAARRAERRSAVAFWTLRSRYSWSRYPRPRRSIARMFPLIASTLPNGILPWQ